MWGFAFMFWLIPLIFLSLVFRRRRWEGGRYGLRWELEEQRGTIERLESQVIQLEERLDFTERLLAGRREPAETG